MNVLKIQILNFIIFQFTPIKFEILLNGVKIYRILSKGANEKAIIEMTPKRVIIIQIIRNFFFRLLLCMNQKLCFNTDILSANNLICKLIPISSKQPKRLQKEFPPFQCFASSFSLFSAFPEAFFCGKHHLRRAWQ